MANLLLILQLLPIPTSPWPQNGDDVYKICQLLFLSVPFALPLLNAVQAPFGRFSAPSRLNINGNLGWFLMEIVSPVTFLACFLSQPLDHVAASSHTLAPFPALLRSLVSPNLARLAQIPFANILLATLFLIHYFQRAVLHSLRSAQRSPMHLSVFIAAVFVNLLNGFLMGSWLGGRSPPLQIPSAALDLSKKSRATQKFKSIASRLGNRPPTISAPGLLPQDTSTVLTHPLFLLGLAGWVIGFASNIYHDEVLLDLRRPKSQRVTKAMREMTDEEEKDLSKSTGPGGPKYGIPKGGLYKYISYPNYLSEWLEWFSFAVAAYSLTPMSPYCTQQLRDRFPLFPMEIMPVALPFPPLTLLARMLIFATSPPALFLFMEIPPMVARATRGHQWYRQKFGVTGDGKGGKYPAERKAVIPGLL